MTAGARTPLWRTAPSWVVAAFVCALALLPAAAAHAVDHTSATSTHSALAHVTTAPIQSRVDSPDAVLVADAPGVPPITTGASTTAAETDSSSTVDSVRTRGPPVQAAV